jgi:DNA-binding Xre family transcriptional regulator
MSKSKNILVLIGNNLRKKSSAKFKSNLEFANVCDISEATVRRVLQGKQNVSVLTLKKICDALNIKISEVLKEEDL